MSCTNPNPWYAKKHTHHSQFSDIEFIEAFEKAVLNPKLFNHEAHLRLAWIYLQSFGEQKAIEKTCSGIKHFDIVCGNGDKFHTTITVASVKMVHHFIKKSKSASYFDFIEEFPQLKVAFKEILGQHYSPEVFISKKAKVDYIAPDVLPFD
ncbi:MULTISPECIES: hypothetical protein [Flavobacteriaceae]|uniref:hypothetical protein n=1 Tax=Flavobacteriaceae TaxID=49546 RepID=UPI002349B49E|nr:hypothetical protein [Muricauda sp. SP22]MDC6363462.1 hypothetical protein [Muricauda sp. SP22]